jgi:phage tail-like protein
MARPYAQDYLQSMRFQVKCVDPQSFSLDGAEADAGFMSVSTPEATTEAVEYREGTYNYPRKFPGNTTVADISMQRGVVLKDTAFWSWMSIVIHGEGEYRSDINIYHYDRSVLKKNVPNYSGTSAIAASSIGGRIYHLYQAFPIRCKVAGDLDATSSDVSVAEFDVAFEYFEVEEQSPPATSPKGNVAATANSISGTSNNVAAGPAAPAAEEA